MNPNKDKAWFDANGNSDNPNAFPIDNYDGEPGSAVDAIKNEENFEQHLAELHAQKQQEIGQKSLDATESISQEQSADISRGAPKITQEEAVKNTRQQTWIGVDGTVYTSHAEWLEAEKARREG